MRKPMQGKTIAVTGGSRGIGAAIVHRLAQDGWLVACLSRKGLGVEEGKLSKTIAKRIIPLACDVNSETSISEAFSQLAAITGRIDGLVNNAGIHQVARSSQMPGTVWDQVMQTNAKAVFTACREAHPYLIQQSQSVIINIGSFFDKIGVKSNLAYCASKAAVGAITRCLAVEWAAQGIRVVNVAPGYIDTELNREALQGPLGDYLDKRIPRKTPGTAQEVAALVAAMTREDMSFVTGETIYIDGGQAIAH